MRVPAAACGQLVSRRRLFNFGGDYGPRGGEVMRYAERRLLGFEQQQMFSVVSDVENYRNFVPWCIASSVSGHRRLADGRVRFNGDLAIGFPPLLKQSYTSVITCRRPDTVHSACTTGGLFHLLDTTWRFHPGLRSNRRTCILDFEVSFAFRSRLHGAFADLFFDQVVTTMVSAFLDEARVRFGEESVQRQQPTVLVYKR